MPIVLVLLVPFIWFVVEEAIVSSLRMRFSSRHYRRRRGLAGRLDVHGNLDPGGVS